MSYINLILVDERVTQTQLGMDTHTHTHTHTHKLFPARLKVKTCKVSQVVVAHTFNPSTWEAEAGRFLNSRLPWSTE
jgi:hypothetical protein